MPKILEFPKRRNSSDKSETPKVQQGLKLVHLFEELSDQRCKQLIETAEMFLKLDREGK